MTQIDVTLFGKLKGLPNYSKVGKQARMKHLFGGVWNLSGGLGCIETSILTTLPSSPPVRRPSRSFTTFACSPVHLWNSLKHKQTMLFRPPGLFATFISDKRSWEKAGLASELPRRVSDLQHFSELVGVFSCLPAPA